MIARYGGDYERDPAPPGTAYTVSHPTSLYVIDPAGRLRAIRVVERGRRSAGRRAAAGAVTMDDPATRRAAPKLADGQRRRAVAAIFAGAGLSTTGYLMSYTVNALIAEALHVDAALVGVPVGGHRARHRDRLVAADARRAGPAASRRAMLGGYLLATGAAIAAAAAIGAHQFWLFVATALVFGIGYGANRIARYSAAALYPAAQRGTVIGWIVWAATIGAVVGPSLLELASRGAESAGSTA